MRSAGADGTRTLVRIPACWSPWIPRRTMLWSRTAPKAAQWDPWSQWMDFGRMTTSRSTISSWTLFRVFSPPAIAVADALAFSIPRPLQASASELPGPWAGNWESIWPPFDVPMAQILVPTAVKLHMFGEQQAESCCSNHFMTSYWAFGKRPRRLQPFDPAARSAA